MLFLLTGKPHRLWFILCAALMGVASLQSCALLPSLGPTVLCSQMRPHPCWRLWSLWRGIDMPVHTPCLQRAPAAPASSESGCLPAPDPGEHRCCAAVVLPCPSRGVLSGRPSGPVMERGPEVALRYGFRAGAPLLSDGLQGRPQETDPSDLVLLSGGAALHDTTRS